MRPGAKRETPSDADITVVGIDPGLANVGLGAVRRSGKSAVLLGSALIRTSQRSSQGERLEKIHAGVEAFLHEYKPQALAIEGQYFHRQLGVAFKVGQAVGVCLLAARRLEVPVFEYGPMQVKQALVGTGQADKAQVAYMVRALLGMKGSPESHHVADALALALTHLSFRQMQMLGGA
jgi:crossover junction endodeoxyribonuclease RuvC